MDENAIEGILRALTIVCGQPMPSSSLFQLETNVTQEETDAGTSFPRTKVAASGNYRSLGRILFSA